MKRKNREINIFSMSALDLFASAMGAFLLIAVMALPYYLKTDQGLMGQIQELEKKLEAIQEAMKKVQTQLQSSQQENQKLKEQAKKMQKELSKTFCVIKLDWDSNYKQDVDLHIYDPDGNEFYYSKRTARGSSASLTIDSKNVKRGAEIWIDKELKQGIYTIKYVYFAGTGPININGMVLTRSFTQDLPVKRVSSPDSSTKIKIATIKVDANGNASLQTY